MQVNVKINVNLDKLDMGRINQIGLVNSSQALIKIAQANAPYETGSLKKSIAGEANTGHHITETTGYIPRHATSVRVGSRKLKYAVRREFENKKNPSRKFYMKRTYDRAQDIVQKKFEEAVRVVISKL